MKPMPGVPACQATLWRRHQQHPLPPSDPPRIDLRQVPCFNYPEVCKNRGGSSPGTAHRPRQGLPHAHGTAWQQSGCSGARRSAVPPRGQPTKVRVAHRKVGHRCILCLGLGQSPLCEPPGLLPGSSHVRGRWPAAGASRYAPLPARCGAGDARFSMSVFLHKLRRLARAAAFRRARATWMHPMYVQMLSRRHTGSRPPHVPKGARALTGNGVFWASLQGIQDTLWAPAGQRAQVSWWEGRRHGWPSKRGSCGSFVAPFPHAHSVMPDCDKILASREFRLNLCRFLRVRLQQVL